MATKKHPTKKHPTVRATGPGMHLNGGKPVKHPVHGLSPTPGRPNLHYQVPFGWVRLENLHTGHFLLCLLGDGVWVMTGGYGGWNVITKPRRLGTTEFDGSSPMSMSGPVMLDGFAEGDSVEPQRHALEAMSKIGAHNEEPPLVKVSGSVPGVRRTWVLNDIAWGDHIRRPSDNQIIRQVATLTFLEYIEDVELEKLPAAKKHKKKKKHKKGAHKKTYKIKKGDTLQSIALHQLGSAKRWHEIARLNHIRDPKHPGKVGHVIKLP